MLGTATGSHLVPSQKSITGPAEKEPAGKPDGELLACIPPTIHPLVGDSMKIDVRLADGDKVGVPLTVTKFQAPTPPLTV